MKTLSIDSLAAPISQQREERRGTMLVALAGLILGTNGVFVLEAGQHPLTTAAFRCAFGCLALTSWGVLTGRLPELKLSGMTLLGAVVSGLLMAASLALHVAAIPRITVGVSTVVFHIQPFWTMALGAWLLHEKVTAKQVAAAALAFVGLTMTTGIVSSLWTGQQLSDEFMLGLLFSLIGSVAMAGFTLLAKGMKSVTSFSLTWWQCFVGAVVTIWWPMFHGWPQELNAWAWLVGLGAIHSGLAYVLMYSGFASLTTGRIAVLQFVYPLTAFVVDWLVYGHTLSTLQIVGLAMMVIAIWSVKRSS